MEESNSNEQLLHRLFDQVNEHLETRWEYFTLSAAEKGSELAANIAGALTIFIFSLLVLFFFLFGFAWWVGDAIGHRAGGFALTGLIFIPIAAIVFRYIRPYTRNKIIQSVLHASKTNPPESHG